MARMGVGLARAIRKSIGAAEAVESAQYSKNSVALHSGAACAVAARACGRTAAAPQCNNALAISNAAANGPGADRALKRMRVRPANELLGISMRAVQLSVLFGPVLLVAPLCLRVRPLRQLWMLGFLRVLRLAGPALIKWGQWAATRHDLFPPDLCDALTQLHADAPSHSPSHSRKVVEQGLQCQLHDVFDSFDERPIASGSIAQVHKAQLKTPARVKRTDRHWPVLSRLLKQDIQEVSTVAVKVRHPGVESTIERDFVLLKAFAQLASVVPALQWLRLDESVRQFQQPLFEQLDLSHEAVNLDKFNNNFIGFGGVVFPRPISPLVNEEVLVETFEAGESVEKYIAGAADPDCAECEPRHKDKALHRRIANLGCKALLKMMLVDNLVHADMHPGNIHVRIDREPGEILAFRNREHLKIVLLDCGMAAQLSKRNQENLIDFFSAVSDGDGVQVAESILSFSTKQTCENKEGFVHTLVRTFERAYDDVIDLSDCIQEMLECVRMYKLNIEAEVSSYIVTTIVLEGWSTALDPQLDMRRVLHNLLSASRKVHEAAQSISQFTEVCWVAASEAATEVQQKLGSLGTRSYDV